MSEMLAKQETVKSLLASQAYQARFKEVLKDKAPTFMASIANLASQPGLRDCEPKSVVASAFVAATLDLPVDKNLGHAWVVPYKRVAQFQLGWKGLAQLALRSGQFRRLNARAVNAEALGGYDSVGEPVIHWDKIDETKEPAGFCVAWELVNGFQKVAYWSKERVQDHAQRYSQAYAQGGGPWKTHFREMALKTVIKNELSKWAPLSIAMQQAVKHDQGAQHDVDAEVIYPDSNPIEIEKPAILEAEVKVEAVPEPTPTTPDKEPPRWVQLQEIVVNAGFNFDQFVKWGKAVGQIDNKAELLDFSEVPDTVIKVCLRSQKGLIDGLKKGGK